MAIVVRYFSTTGAGAEDGTTWADRAPFISGGAYSTILTGFDFNAGDSLEVRLGPGTYNCPAIIATAIFTSNPPRPANPLTIHGCDTNGDRIVPTEWNCCQGSLPTTGYPVLDLGVYSVNLSNLNLRCLYLTGSGGNVVNSGLSYGSSYEYCRIESTSSSNTNPAQLNGNSFVHSCHIICTGNGWNALCVSLNITNCRLEGNPSATSGNRFGMSANTSGMWRPLSRNCLLNIPGYAVVNSRPAVDGAIGASELTIVNCATVANQGAISGLNFPNTGTNLNYNFVQAQNCFIANCGIGIQGANIAAKILGNRLRCTTNYNVGANSIIAGNYEASGNDADEFVDAANGDYRIKSTSIYWGKGIGAGDGPASGGTSRPLSPFYQGVIG